MKNNKLICAILFAVLVLAVSKNSYSQTTYKFSAMFGTLTFGDSLRVTKAPATSCGGSGLCSASPTPVSGSATVMMMVGGKKASSKKMVSGTYTITMKIQKRGLNRGNKIHRKHFRKKKYHFDTPVRVPAKYITGVPEEYKNGYAIIPAGDYAVRNPFLRKFEMTITGVTFTNSKY